MPNVSPFLTPPKQRTIIHVDGDAFFASCEQALNPRYQNRPVVTGEERGIVSSMSYEAKALGIQRGMPIWQLRKQYPQVTVMPSHFEVYEKISDGIADIISQYTPTIERYSIDEAFADLTGWDITNNKTPTAIAAQIQQTILKTLGVGVSIGVGNSKVLAKVGSKHDKPRGLVHITEKNRRNILSCTPLSNIWGIGPRLSKRCGRYRMFTALDFADQPFDLVRARFTMPVEELWHELNGISVMPVNTEHDEKKSLTRSHTFHPASNNFSIVCNELLGNLERVLLRARRRNLMARTIHIFIKTQDFEYHSTTRELPEASAFTIDLTTIITDMCREIFNPRHKYRATGITLHDMVSSEIRQDSLFNTNNTERKLRLYDAIDKLSIRHGRAIIRTGAITMQPK